MDDLISHLKTLAPVAEAIVYITRQGSQVEALGKRLSQQETDLQTGEERLAEIERLCQIARTSAEQAKASVIEAQGKIESMVEGAKNEAKRMLNEAQNQANTIAQRERIKFGAEEARLRQGIQALNEERVALDTAIQHKRNDHASVMSSLASLKARLGAA